MHSKNRTVRIEAYFDDLTSIEGEVSSSGDDTFKDIDIDEGVALKPLFLSLRSSPVVGGEQALAFLLTAASGVAAKTLAEVVFKWFKKTKANRLKIERTEVLITRPDEVIRIIREIAEKDLP